MVRNGFRMAVGGAAMLVAATGAPHAGAAANPSGSITVDSGVYLGAGQWTSAPVTGSASCAGTDGMPGVVLATLRESAGAQGSGTGDRVDGTIPCDGNPHAWRVVVNSASGDFVAGGTGDAQAQVVAGSHVTVISDSQAVRFGVSP